MRTRDAGREDDGRRPWIEVHKDATGWHWTLWSENGRALATNAEPYARRESLTDALKLILRQIGPHTQILQQVVRPGFLPPPTGQLETRAEPDPDQLPLF